MNPYEVLGVATDADAPVIRKAYRDRARRAHPDGDGSPEKFALVKLAHDILNDPGRRERFDRTGDASETTPDNSLSVAMQSISAALDEALAEVEGRGRKAHQVGELLQIVERSLIRRRDKVKADLPTIKHAAMINKGLLGRFTAKDGESPLEALIRGRCRLVQDLLAKAEMQMSVLDEAIKMVRAQAFRADAEPERQMAPPWLMQQMSGMS